MLLIAGSGPTDRDGNSIAAGVKPANLKLIAEALAAGGVRSLRYDKRGVGKSAPAMVREADLRFTTYRGRCRDFSQGLLKGPASGRPASSSWRAIRKAP